MEPQKSNSEQLQGLFKSFNKKYLDDILKLQEPEKLISAHDIVHDPNLKKSISEVVYGFSKN